MPDIIEKDAAHDGNHVLYESKVYTSLKTSDNLGNGTARGGGSPSTAAGNLVAFGCTEEKLLRDIYGARPRGAAADGPFNHTTGLGWVAAQAGYYTDAIKNKKNTVIALIAENFGGVTPAVTALLRRLDKRSCADTTRYGEYSTHDFYGHHAAAISLAIVTGEAVVSGVLRRETALAGGEHRG